MRIVKQSPFTGKLNVMDINITKGQLSRIDRRGNTGEYIQDVIPHLTATEREFLMTGMSPEEQAEMFGEPDEEVNKDEALNEL